MKAVLIPVLLATAGTQDTVLTVAAIVAAVILLLNQFGLLPKGKTFERVQLERNEMERELLRREATISALENRPNLEEHAKLLSGITKSLEAHDARMMQMADRILSRLDIIEVAVVPPERIRGD